MKRNRQRLLLNIFISLAASALFVGAISDIYARYAPIRDSAAGFSLSLAAAFILSVGFLICVLLVVWLPQWLLALQQIRKRISWGRWLFALPVGVFTHWIYYFSFYNEVFGGLYLRSLLYIFALGLMTWLVTNDETRPFRWEALLQVGIVFGVISMLEDVLQEVVPYPFSLSWSEGNRLWDYSILYGRHIYEFPLDKPIPAYIDRGRQSLWGIPFLFPGLTITAARLWDAFLFSIPYAFLGWFVFRPVKGRLNIWLFGGLWAMLFLGQGPIYTPLILAAILVAGSRRMPLFFSALFVALASYYASITRSTWIFAPAMWAGLIAFLEENPYGVKTTLQRWIRAGTLAASGLFGSLGVSAVLGLLGGISGVVKPRTDLVSSEGLAAGVSRQPLIWERLWPNATYAPGIVLGLVLAVAPLVILLILFGLRRKRWNLNVWQRLALWGSMLAFLVVGIIVSVKVGGGSNLHNLDMLLIGLLFTLGLAWESGLGDWALKPGGRSWWGYLLVFLMIFIPVVEGVISASPRNLPDSSKAADALKTVNDRVDEARGKGDILFMDQRQLLTFGFIKNVPLVAEYEKKRMMDEALAGNANYFAPFHQDLAAHRFVLIISEPLWIKTQEAAQNFGSENNAFVDWVSQPVLCYYQPVDTFLDIGLQILVPRDQVLSKTDSSIQCPLANP